MSAARRPFPTRDEIAAFVRDSPTPVTKREIARAFNVRGDERQELKALIRDLQGDGTIARGRSRRMAAPASLPATARVRVEGIDEDGEVIARPADWEGPGPAPRIFMAPERRGQPALAEGDQVLAKLRRLPDGSYEGRTFKRIDRLETERLVGVYRRAGDGGVIEPAERRRSQGFAVAEADRHGAADGELVVAELGPRLRAGGRRATVLDRLGDPDHPRAISLIAIHAAGIPTVFPAPALAEAEAARPAPLGDREDLRELPLVTIDGADARDFDDAVWAEPIGDPAKPDGWRLVVAIADVAHYVPPGSALDREALKRGNSCYFPDRVVPMLPEALSNGLCSLKPNEDRACFAAHLTIDAQGRLKKWRFARALMRSVARLTYEQVEHAHGGRPDTLTKPLLEPVIAPLYGAFAALKRARDKRGTLDLELPERQVALDAAGNITGITVRERLDSHKLIEEFMIAANVAAASVLQDKQQPALYRVHAEPDRARVQAVAEFLAPLGYRLAKGQVLKPRAFTQLLQQASGKPEAPLINTLILRAQAQAVYASENIGHFGLALSRYAHFTSPIRRYADLVVHRALIRLLRLGDDGMSDDEMRRLDETGQAVSFTERRAAEAERDASSRYVALYLSQRIGAVFQGRIGSVTRFGLFVTLDETGADGLVPVSTLADDFYVHDEKAHALIGRRHGRTYRLGERVTVKLIEADPIAGSTVFTLVEAEPESARKVQRRPRQRRS